MFSTFLIFTIYLKVVSLILAQFSCISVHLAVPLANNSVIPYLIVLQLLTTARYS